MSACESKCITLNIWKETKKLVLESGDYLRSDISKIFSRKTAPSQKELGFIPPQQEREMIKIWSWPRELDIIIMPNIIVLLAYWLTANLGEIHMHIHNIYIPISLSTLHWMYMYSVRIMHNDTIKFHDWISYAPIHLLNVFILFIFDTAIKFCNNFSKCMKFKIKYTCITKIKPNKKTAVTWLSPTCLLIVQP